MESLQEFLSKTFLENTLHDFLWCFGIIAIALMFRGMVASFFSKLVHRSMKKFTSDVDVSELSRLEQAPIKYLILLIAVYVGANQLTYPESWELAHPDTFGVRMLVEMGFAVLVIISVTWILIRMVDFIGLIMESRAAKTDSKVDDQLVLFFKDIMKIFIVIMSIFFTLASVFKMNIATLIGGLGIGGLAIALAAKETLENLMGSVTIFLDRPFVIGDKVKVHDTEGHVEHIGLRSTVIRTFQKSKVSVPNKLMVDAELENTTEREYWRVKFLVGVLYSTDPKDIRNIIKESLEYLNDHPLVEENPIVKLDSFNSSSIDILYYILIKTPDWTTYLEAKEEIHFKVIDIVHRNNTDFAFPSRTIYHENVNPVTDDSD